MMVDVFHNEGIVAVSNEIWKRCWKTPLSSSAQNRRVLPQIPSGPGLLLILIFLKRLATLSCSITAV